MRHLKVLGVALVAMFVFGITATSAFALPDISIALGGAYPIHLQFADNGKTVSKLETTAGRKLEGQGLLLLFLVEALGALGKFEALFLKVVEGKEKTPCNSSGDKEGEVLLKGEFHLVPLTLTPLTTGVLYLFSELEIVCAKVKVKVKGSVLSTLNAGTGEITEIGGKLEGSKGKNTLTKFFNDAGTEIEAKLESNFGTGFLQSDEVVGEEVKTPALEGKMFEITGT